MDDLYSALIQGVPTQSDRQAALAAALRRQNLLGQIGMASGDRVAGPTGKELISGANTGAEELGKEREMQNSQDIAQQWHNQQTQHEQDQLGQQMKIANMTDQRQRELAALLAQNKLDVQDDKNSKVSPGKNLSATAQKEMESYRDALEGVQNAKSTFTPGYGGMGRNLGNSIAANAPALATDNMKNAQNWWSNYGRQFTLPEMHNLFGARITDVERKAFEGVHINPNMNDQQIQQNLDQITKMVQNKLSRRAKDYASQGYNVGDYSDLATPQGAAAPPARPGDKYMQPPQPQGQPQGQPQQPPANFLQNALRSSPNPLVNPAAGLFQGNLGGQ